jgi:hypothetical protein
MYRTFLAITVAAACLAGSGAQAATLHFTATLTGGAQVPPVTTKGAGTATITVNTVTKAVHYRIRFHGLSGPVTMAHFHGPADPGANAGVAVPITGKLTTPIVGSATFTDAQLADLEGGKDYINLHTAANPGGEIRGQVMPAKK